MKNVIEQIREAFEIWNGYGANLKYNTYCKDGLVYIEDIELCKTEDVVKVYDQCDAVKIELKNNTRIVVIIHWFNGEDAYISNIRHENLLDEDDCTTLYNVHKNRRLLGIINMNIPGIVNKLDDGKKQIQDLTYNVLRKANLKYETCIINDADLDRVYLTIDGQEYTIRTWSISASGNKVQYRIDYTLFINLWNEEKGYGYGKEIDCGMWHVYKDYE